MARERERERKHNLRRAREARTYLRAMRSRKRTVEVWSAGGEMRQHREFLRRHNDFLPGTLS